MSDLPNNLLFVYSNYPYLVYTSSLLLGLIVGSFLNVVIYRLPVMMERDWREQCEELCGKETPESPKEKFNLVVPRSRCGSCDRMIKAWQNIPVISYLLLKGRCSACGAKISLQYPVVELITGLLSVWVVVHFGFAWTALAALLLTWALIALSVIDFRETLLPDDITLPFLWLGLLCSLGSLFVTPVDAIIGAAAGYLSLWAVYWVFKLITGKEGMGYGDFKLLAMLGAWMGWQALPAIVILSSFIGAVVGLSLIVFTGRDRQIPIPFGPYLAVAGWIYLLYGSAINNWYLNWMQP
jgi:leader peptidase (prepilin peptidase)/N-methyltransferase